MISEQRRKELNYISFLSKSVGRKFSREQNVLLLLSKDLHHNSQCIIAQGIFSADEICKTDAKDSIKQNYFDFLVNFESLRDRMKEFHWSAEFLADYGIDFKEYRKMYFAVSQ